MKKKTLSHLKWLLPLLLLVGSGLKLITVANREESKLLRGYQTYEAALEALEKGDAETAYIGFIQAADELDDPNLKGLALYQAANVGWLSGLADYTTLVRLYQQSLRYYPGFYEAAFNLEYLYWLKENAPDQIPQPEPGREPGREEYIPNGDV